MKFKSDIEVQAGLKDASGALGASGQILSSTNGNVSWVTPTVNTVARDVQNEVKAGVAINKGQAVYVTGADGTNIIVGLASNTSEATSSKTLGLLNATVAINGFADVIQIGRLAGLNTIGAAVGDPVWLGTGGNLIYGLINKPYAPANLVFIGVVTRVNINNGEIFVSVQNGFELNELHDVDLKTTIPVNGDILGYNGTLWVNKTIAGWLGYTPANASGTTNYVSKFTGTTTLGNSQLFDNGTNVGIGTASPISKLHTTGTTTIGSGVFSSPGTMQLLTGGTSPINNRITYSTDGTGWKFAIGKNQSGTVTDQFVIQDNGNVGISTSSPSQKLHIGGVGSAIALDTTGVAASSLIRTVNDYDLSLYCGRGTVTEVIIGSDNFRVLTSSTERMRITPTGNVGIGTSSPSGKLDVIGNLYTSGEFRIGSIYAGTGVGLIKSLAGVLSLFTWGDSTNIQIGGNDVIFKPEAGSERMRLTSTGNLGIGISSPLYKTDISGNLRFTTGYLNSNNCFERVFPSGISFPSATANLAADIILGNVSFWGYIEVEITGYYSDQSSVGKLTKLFAVGTNPGNNIYTNESRIVDSMGTVPDNVAIGDMSWDATNSRFRIPISHIVSTGNSYTVKVRMLTEQAGAKAVFDAISISSNYTLTALTKQFPYYNNRLGIGNVSPAVNLDIYGSGTVQARIQSASGGDIRFSADTFGRVGTYSASDLALLTSGTEKVRITTAGNVGIGTTAPGAKLHVVGNTYIQSGILYTDTIGSYSTGSVTLNSSTNFIVPSGNIGIGTASPSEKLTVLGNGMFYNSTTSWAPNTAAGLFLSGSSSGGASFISTYLDTSTLQIGAGVSQKTGFIINGQTSASGSSIAFRTGGTESMKINSLGEILIGQTSAIYSATNRANLTIGKSAGALIILGTSTSSNGYLFFNNTDIELANSTTSGAVFFRTNGTEKMRITSSGNIGIGTTTPGASLDVQGTFNASNTGAALNVSGGVAYAGYQGTYDYSSAGATSSTINSNDGQAFIQSFSAAYARSPKLGIQAYNTNTGDQDFLVAKHLIQNSFTPSNPSTPAKWIRIWDEDTGAFFYMPMYQ